MNREKNRKKLFNVHVFIICIILCCVFFSSCSHKENVNESNKNEETVSSDDALQSFIEDEYGICDSHLYGSRITRVISSGGGKSYRYEETLDDTSKDGAVFYKLINTEEYPNNFVCAYISDEYQKGSIQLVINHYLDYKEKSGGIRFPILWERGNSRCYVAVVNNLLVCISIGESKSITADSDEANEYNEEISVYDMTSNFESEDKLFRISRQLSHGDGDREFKNYYIEDGSQKIRYSAGYDYYSETEEERVTTQQEFCDRANELLANNSIDFIILNKTSWNNRWFGMDIDESSVGTEMAKIDFIMSEERMGENDALICDLEIEVNKEKEESDEDEYLEEIDDTPIDYVPETENNQSSEDNSFNIDGFWHSTDYRYVYHIYTQNPDNGFGTLYYADLEGDSKAKHGQVKQTSSSSVILKAMEDDGFSPEVYASNNQLVSDEITLIRADDELVSNVVGTWSNDNTTYTFDSDGTYEIQTSNDWYWGMYFIINENKIVLGKHLDNLGVYDYTLEGNSFTLDNCDYVRQ